MIFLAQNLLTTPIMLQLGVGGIFAIMILRLVFDFIDRREIKRINGSPSIPPTWAVEALTLVKRAVDKMAVMGRLVEDLHDWHKPENGVQEWKNKAMVDLMREFKEAMEHASERSTKAIENNNALIERMIPIVQSAEKKM